MKHLTFLTIFATIIGITMALPSSTSRHSSSCDHNCEHQSESQPCCDSYSSSMPCETQPPLQAPAPDLVQCEHGAFACLEDNVAQCNWGNWVVTPCGEGTRCMPNDWECVAEIDWDRVFEQVNPKTSSVLNAPSPTEVPPQPPSDTCENGEFQCYGNDIIQCNLGSWVLHQCGQGTRCIDNDFECIPFDQYEQVSSQIGNS